MLQSSSPSYLFMGTLDKGIHYLKKEGKTIIISTHIFSLVEKLCDRVGIIKDGCLLRIENVDYLRSNNLNFVTITSPDINNIIKDLKLDNNLLDNNMIRFKNNIDINTLIKILAKYQVDKILIEEATLEDIFLHFYK